MDPGKRASRWKKSVLQGHIDWPGLSTELSDERERVVILVFSDVGKWQLVGVVIWQYSTRCGVCEYRSTVRKSQYSQTVGVFLTELPGYNYLHVWQAVKDNGVLYSELKVVLSLWHREFEKDAN